MPTPPLAAISEVEDARPAAPRSCTRDDQPARGQLERALDQLLARERVADLHARPLVLVALVEVLRGQHARPADAVAPGRGAEEHDEVARAGGARAHELVRAQQADAERVDERVVAVGGVEDRLAGDVRDADAVAVAADAAHDAAEQLARALLVERAEPQRVAQRDRPRAHREDVAQDAAHARGRALVGLDGRGVVVALDLERDGEAVADVDHAGVLTRALQHARAVAWAGGAARGASACSRNAPTRAARRRPARSRSGCRSSVSSICAYSASVSPRARWSGCWVACVTRPRDAIEPSRRDRPWSAPAPGTRRHRRVTSRLPGWTLRLTSARGERMTGKQVQLPWGRRRSRRRRRSPRVRASAICELGVARLSGADGEQLLRFFYRAVGAHDARAADAAPGRGRGARAGAAQAARAAQARRRARQVRRSGRRAGRARARRRAPPRSPRAPPRPPTGRVRGRPRRRAFESTGKSSPATRCQVPMPPSAAAANGPTCSQRRALPKRTTSSTASGVATPLSTIQSASRRSACCRRFQMKPGTSRCTSTGRLPQPATAARASSTASGRLCGPAITSTSGISSGGFQ